MKLNWKKPKDLFEFAAFFLLVFLCAFIPLRNIGEYYFGTAIKLVPDVLILLLFVWHVLRVRFRLKFLPQDFLFLAFLLVAGINTVFVKHLGIGPFVFQVRALGIYYIFYFVLRNVRLEKGRLACVLRVLQGCVVLLSFFGVAEKIYSKSILFPKAWADEILYASNYARVYSFFNNPNTFGLFLTLVFFFSLFCHLQHGLRTNALVYGVLLGSLLLTMSRSSMIAIVLGSIGVFCYLFVRRRELLTWKLLLSSAAALLYCFLLYFGMIAGVWAYAVGGAGILLYLVVRFRKISPWRASLGIVAALLLTVVLYRGALDCAKAYMDYVKELEIQQSQGDGTSGGGTGLLQNPVVQESIKVEANNRMENTLTEEERTHSAADGRFYSLKTGLKIFREHPVLGTGFGTYGSAASRNYDTYIDEQYDLPNSFYSDNEYIVVLVETGIVGTVLFALFLLSILWHYRRDYAKICACVLIGWFGLFYNIFEVQIGAMLFWVFLSLSSGKKEKEKE